MWYAVQVETGREDQTLAEVLLAVREAGVCGDVGEVFVPKRRIFERVGRQMVEREVALWPGYLIVETSRCGAPRVARALRRSARLARMLACGDSIAPLAEEEAARLDGLTRPGERVVGVSEGYVEKGRIVIVSGPLMGREALVTKINRRKKTAHVRFSICGREVEAELALELMRQNRERRDHVLEDGQVEPSVGSSAAR